MNEVSFYHLQSEPLARALPRLLEKVTERGFRVLVRGQTEEQLEQLDDALWSYRADSFLPHAVAGEGVDPAAQPVLLTRETEGNANGAAVLVLIEHAPAADLAAFDRCLYLFDGEDEASLTAARTRWRELKDSDIPVSYYQQTEAGWKKMA
ncbi:DNA polymerase III subunit chi [Sneathiella chungangensis]|uniref:DNA polymerase III subunit chi n=1 Tax=Sneathiella chungangensis TaxID=1418234 RepID=A0A845MDM2_9PROT|nr:DNA polymerase III subunit chi [Sneathiella chungangensis]